MSPQQALAEASYSAPSNVRALFYAVGLADPELMPRLVAPLGKLGVVPCRIHASREDGDGSELAIELRFRDLPDHLARQIESALRRTVGVRQLIVAIEAA
jgi:hypothetical protein